MRDYTQQQQQQPQESQKHILNPSILKGIVVIIIKIVTLVRISLVKTVFSLKQAKILIGKDRIKQAISNLFNILKLTGQLLDLLRT